MSSVASVFDAHRRPISSSVVTWTAQEPIYSSGDRYWPGEALVVASRLYFPVSVLAAWLFVIFLCLGCSFPYLSDAGAPWLKWSHVLLAFAFLLVQLTNRRYGSGYAFAQILLTLAICDALAVLRQIGLVRMLPTAVLPNAREVIAFIAAFMAAGYLSVIAFDVVRGPRWWTAPLTGAYVSSLGFALLYYPLAYVGTGASWVAHMSTHAGVLIAASVVGLLPYWLLRPVIKPLPGFGGY
jgi:queuosine precursor transporter